MSERSKARQDASVTNIPANCIQYTSAKTRRSKGRADVLQNEGTTTPPNLGNIPYTSCVIKYFYNIAIGSVINKKH
jgi:hypothetical protein